jgi:hypothetical protein
MEFIGAAKIRLSVKLEKHALRALIFVTPISADFLISYSESPESQEIASVSEWWAIDKLKIDPFRLDQPGSLERLANPVDTIPWRSPAIKTELSFEKTNDVIAILWL